jgi:2-dehydro-3-deoxyphosphogluconate aldolase/(4S)-4-hydroxy-2-oxoglutarate aldolase
MSRSGPLERLCETGVVPVVVLDDAAAATRLGAALARGGLPLVEVTLRTAGAVDAIRTLAESGELLVGAGTVIRPEQVDIAREAGAMFIVTPGVSLPVIDRCHELGMAVLPGVSSPTDVIAALDRGITLLKFFPAEASGGVPMLRALAGPFPDVRFVPSGGVNAANAVSYLGLPTVVAIGGSWMVAPELIRSGDFDTIATLSAEAVALVAEARA